jgi:hypothetical protein
MTVIHQVAPRYTNGSPAQVDSATAEHVKRAELLAFEDAIASDDGAERAKANALGLAGIVEALIEWPDGSRTIRDEITGTSRTVHPVQEVQTPEALDLTADLRTVQALVTRRGAAWLAKWAAMHQGIEPGGLATDPAFATYVRDFPNTPDPRD